MLLGIGSGPHTSGQVLVYHDLLGMLQHAHHAKVSPSFSKTYVQVGHLIQEGLNSYKEEVEQGQFPNQDFSPYKVLKSEAQDFENRLFEELEKQNIKLKPEAKPTEGEKENDETIKVY